MEIHYQFPIVRFYGDDPEDSKTEYQEASIKVKIYRRKPCEALIHAPGYNFKLIFGKTACKTVFLCIPNRASGFELKGLSCTTDNIEQMMCYCNNLDYEDICAIAFGLNSIHQAMEGSQTNYKLGL